MWEALERLFVIMLCAGVAIFCLMDARRNVRRGYYPNPAYWVRSNRGPQILRQDHPVDFWSVVALKIGCAVIASIFAVIYLALALTR
jgi:hypothetical protein